MLFRRDSVVCLVRVGGSPARELTKNRPRGACFDRSMTLFDAWVFDFFDGRELYVIDLPISGTL